MDTYRAHFFAQVHNRVRVLLLKEWRHGWKIPCSRKWKTSLALHRAMFHLFAIGSCEWQKCAVFSSFYEDFSSITRSQFYCRWSNCSFLWDDARPSYVRVSKEYLRVKLPAFSTGSRFKNPSFFFLPGFSLPKPPVFSRWLFDLRLPNID